MGNLSTYTVHDLVVMAESNGSHPECSQVPTAAIVREIDLRILALEEAVRVLAESRVEVYHEIYNSGGGPVCGGGPKDDTAMNNPIARAAVEKARKGA